MPLPPGHGSGSGNMPLGVLVGTRVRRPGVLPVPPQQFISSLVLPPVQGVRRDRPPRGSAQVLRVPPRRVIFSVSNNLTPVQSSRRDPLRRGSAQVLRVPPRYVAATGSPILPRVVQSVRRDQPPRGRGQVLLAPPSKIVAGPGRTVRSPIIAVRIRQPQVLPLTWANPLANFPIVSRVVYGKQPYRLQSGTSKVLRVPGPLAKISPYLAKVIQSVRRDIPPRGRGQILYVPIIYVQPPPPSGFKPPLFPIVGIRVRQPQVLPGPFWGMPPTIYPICPQVVYGQQYPGRRPFVLGPGRGHSQVLQIVSKYVPPPASGAGGPPPFLFFWDFGIPPVPPVPHAFNFGASISTSPTFGASFAMCVFSHGLCFQGEDLLLTFQTNPVVNLTGLAFEYAMAQGRGGIPVMPTITATTPNAILGQAQVIVPSAYLATLTPAINGYVAQLRCITPGSQAVLAQILWTISVAIVPVGG